MGSMPSEMLSARERIPVSVHEEPHDVSRAVAREIADLIRQREGDGLQCVLGLATGSTPTGVYAELVRMHQQEGLSFRNVVTFNLDEYYPMDADAEQSYRRFMDDHLFDHVDIPAGQIHMPDGTLPLEEVSAHCAAYEKAIQQAGGLDLQLLGIGRTGHIGFNEPGSGRHSVTRLITLDNVTRTDAAGDFFGKHNVPRRAITMGVATILGARRVVLMALGEGKAPIVVQAVEGDVNDVIAASFLQEHDNAEVILDRAAADRLTRYTSPWLLGSVAWDERVIRKAVIWLAQRVDKPILKLTDEDYNENHLQDLLAEYGSAYEINLRVFHDLNGTITGWPGGKPAHLKLPGDRKWPRDEIHPKRILVFSPHPDDDVISMGGCLMRLAEQGHEVHVAYQVSGSLAVFDEDAERFLEFASSYNELFGISPDVSGEIQDRIAGFMAEKRPGQEDSDDLQLIKREIRRGEARAAGRHCGIPVDRLHFQDLPFYDTGTVRKKPLSEEDILLTVELLDRIKPHMIFAAGDLSDPHGTHRVCLTAIFEAFGRLADHDWYQECVVWLYRGAWQEWEPERIDMSVPLSPGELERKRMAIFKHESQKDKAMFPGSDAREFWERAEDRNRATARLFDKLGLAEYEAVEAFVRWRGTTTSL